MRAILFCSCAHHVFLALNTWCPLECSKSARDVSIIGEQTKDGVGTIWSVSAPVLSSVVSERLLRGASLAYRVTVVPGFEMRCAGVRVMVATVSSFSAYKD